MSKYPTSDAMSMVSKIGLRKATYFPDDFLENKY